MISKWISLLHNILLYLHYFVVALQSNLVTESNPKSSFKNINALCVWLFPLPESGSNHTIGAFLFIIMKPKMLTFLYNNAIVNFDFNPLNSNMMINATQMAKIFDKRVDAFLRNDSARTYIEVLKNLPKDEKLWSEFTQMCVNSDINSIKNNSQFTHFYANQDINLLEERDILQTRGHQGTWMHRLLAIEFASWLEPSFKLWVNLAIEQLIFGNYKKHFEASAKYEEARVRMDFLRLEIEQTGSKDLMLEYFECERTMKKSANDKRQASKQSINLFTYQEIAN